MRLCADEASIEEKFIPVMRSAGMSLSPFNAWVVLKGLETLSIRDAGAEACGRLSWPRGWISQDHIERVFLSRVEVAPATRVGHGAAVGFGWGGGVVCSQRSTPKAAQSLRAAMPIT